jgi:hypothetical protein
LSALKAVVSAVNRAIRDSRAEAGAAAAQ